MTRTDDVLSIAESVLLAPANLNTQHLASLLNNKLTGQADYADIYFQHSRHEAWVLEDGIVRDASFNTERGAGVRIVQGEKTGFAYSDDITLAALQQASGAARAITQQGQDRQIQLASRAAPPARYGAMDPLLDWPATEKVALLQRIDAMARSLDPAIVEVTASLSAEQDVVMVVASDGTLAADVRPLIRCNVSVIAERAGPVSYTHLTLPTTPYV